MAYSRESAEKFVEMYEGRFVFDVDDVLRTQSPRSDINLERKRELYRGKVYDALAEVLRDSYVTEPCKEYLVKIVGSPLSYGSIFGIPVELVAGINLRIGLFGIFDSTSDLADIEGNLLRIHDRENSIAPGYVLRPGDFAHRQLNQRWHIAYHERYGKDPRD